MIKSKDQRFAAKFQKRFRKMIIGQDKKSGHLVVLFKSKKGEVIIIKTLQKKPEILEQGKDEA